MPGTRPRQHPEAFPAASGCPCGNSLRRTGCPEGPPGPPRACQSPPVRTACHSPSPDARFAPRDNGPCPVRRPYRHWTGSDRFHRGSGTGSGHGPRRFRSGDIPALRHTLGIHRCRCCPSVPIRCSETPLSAGGRNPGKETGPENSPQNPP